MFQENLSHGEREYRERGPKAPAVMTKERQGTPLANNFGITMLSEATEKQNIFGIKGPRELRMILSLHLHLFLIKYA